MTTNHAFNIEAIKAEIAAQLGYDPKTPPIQVDDKQAAVPGVVDQSELATASDGVAKVVLEAVQAMLLKLALQMERDDYEARRGRQARGIALAKERGAYAGRKFDKDKHERVMSLRAAGNSIAEAFRLAKCSTSLVKLVCAGAKS